MRELSCETPDVTGTDCPEDDDLPCARRMGLMGGLRVAELVG